MRTRTVLLIYGGVVASAIIAPIARVLAGFGRWCRKGVRRGE